MFGKKKKEQGLFNTMDDSRVVVYDFVRRIPIESYRPVEYKLYHKLRDEEMHPKLDRHLDALFAGSVDDGNGDMLDNIIFRSYRESGPDLILQKHTHEDMIRRIVAKRTSDREDFVNLREDRKEELLRLEKEYDEICDKGGGL